MPCANIEAKFYVSLQLIFVFFEAVQNEMSTQRAYSVLDNRQSIDDYDDREMPFVDDEDNVADKKSTSIFVKLTVMIMLLILILFGGGSLYNDSSSNIPDDIEDIASYLWYDRFIDIGTFTVIGFGFSMTSLRKYGLSALSLTLLIVSLAIPFGVHSSFELIDFLFLDESEVEWETVSGYDLNQGLTASITVLISFGVIAGRTTVSQLVFMTVLELMVWTGNTAINLKIWGLHDVGFSIHSHLFATYFGLAVSWIIEPAVNDKDNKSMSQSELFSFIGTLFLWLYWPSVNGFYAETDYMFRDRAVVNTVFALCGSTVAAFSMSRFVHRKSRKFNMVHIRQCSLAGGVGVGAAADLYLHPAGALSIGIICGIISVLGQRYCTRFMEQRLKIQDSRGIQYVHGLPGILRFGFESRYISDHSFLSML